MASRPNKPGKETTDDKAEKKSGKAKLVIIISIVLLLVGAGGGAAWYSARGSNAAPVPKTPVFLSLETFTVNLEPENSDQHLQTNLTLKVGDDEAVNRIKLHMPEVRNRVLLLLSSKTASQVASVEGKRKLASELAAEINQPFSEGGKVQAVESVLFTSFVIQ
jgi:flagellar protein FliL